MADTDRGTELLPEDWNNQGELYKLRYLRGRELYILTALQTQEMALFNLLNVQSQEVTNVQLNVGETVKGRTGNLTEVVNDAPKVLKKIEEELLTAKAEQEKRKREEERQREREQSPPRRNPLLEDRGIGINRGIPDPFSVGRGDLDPLGRLGGGMLFPGPGQGHFPPPGGFRDPGFGILGGLPPGAVPPGARFDPFGPLPSNPPSRGRPRNNPDNDHLPPPGYDDMFM